MKNEAGGRRGEGGQVLVGVILLMMILLIMVPALVQWTQVESKASVGDAKNTIAFNLASAAVERGYWKIKSSTNTCAEALAGTPIAGYSNEVTYSDVSGGTYRIYFASGPSSKEVTVTGEGRDNSTGKVRAITAVYQNNTLFSPLMAQGNIQMNCSMVPYWGPILSKGDIVLNDDVEGSFYWPQKYAQGVVWCNNTGTGTCNDTIAGHARDMNGLTPPNTDNTEWWSDYPYVPEVPLLDFATFKTSATNSGTLNVYGCANTGATWDKRLGHGGCLNVLTPHATHFGNSWNHPKSPQFGIVGGVSTNSYTWYWDGDLTFSGGGNGPGGVYPAGNGTGIEGNIIVRGNLTIDSPGDYQPVETVPVNAWMQQERINKTVNDSSTSGEYPADIGLHASNTTMKTGWGWTGGTYGSGSPTPTGDLFYYPSNPVGSQGSSASTPGIKGFVYVGGNLNLNNSLDINGVVWVVGTVTSQSGCSNDNVSIMYDDSLVVPTLNVILTRESWNEVAPSSGAWH
jgi:hypothetical protein